MTPPPDATPRVIVVGAGVVGLSCAVRLLEAGHRVDVVARDLPLETTSAVAAAIWRPCRALPQERVASWARTTYATLSSLAAPAELGGDPDAGVRMVSGTEVLAAGEPDPWWIGAAPGAHRASELPAGWTAGWSFVTPIADMSTYLRWLSRRVETLGGTITRLNLSALPAPPPGGVVVNCSGLGARLLGADRSVVPVRGQVVVLEQFGLERWWRAPATGEDRTYVVPRLREIIVGGTEVEGEWSRTPSAEVAQAILERAARLEPRLRAARVLRHRVGLRPVRPAIRVERVGDVVHCYGHGGAGVTLSWGTADEVVALVHGERPAGP